MMQAGCYTHQYFLYGALITDKYDHDYDNPNVARDLAKKYFPKEWAESAYTLHIGVEATNFWSGIGSTGAIIEGTDYKLRMIGNDVFIYPRSCAWWNPRKVDLPSEETIQKFDEWIRKENIPHLGIGGYFASEQR